jgi:hypothetical protein
MAKSAQDRRVTHLRPMGPSVIADLDTLLIALYVELTDRIIPHPSERAARWARPASGAHRRRAGLPGRGAGPAALQRRARYGGQWVVRGQRQRPVLGAAGVVSSLERSFDVDG